MKTTAYSLTPSIETLSGPARIVGVKVLCLTDYWVTLEVRLHFQVSGNYKVITMVADRIMRHKDEILYSFDELYDWYFYAIYTHARQQGE